MNTFIYYAVIISSIHGVVTHENACCSDGDVLIKRPNTMCFNSTAKTAYNISNIRETCDFYIIIDNGSIFYYGIEDDGKLNMWTEANGHKAISDYFEKDTYCVGEKDSEDVITLCVQNEDDSRQTILAYCLTVSSVFLILTALVYILLSELRDLHGKIIINLCCAFATSNIMFAVMELAPYEDMTLCAVKGFIAYFFSMSSFFWMNSLSIEVLRSTRAKRTHSSNWTDLLYYSIYSWGGATILTTCVITANYVQGSHPLPGIGYDKCWFFSVKEQWIYMYSVLAILIAINICIFFYTSITLWRRTFRSSSMSSLKFKFTMCLKLFIVLGVAWIFEIASSAHGEDFIIWFITDIFNALQGFIIFLILVIFRRRAIKGLHKRGWTFCASTLVEKILAKVEDEEDNIIDHTEIPMEDKN